MLLRSPSSKRTVQCFCALAFLLVLAGSAAAAQSSSRLLRAAGTAGLIGAAALIDPFVRVNDVAGGSGIARGLSTFGSHAGEYGTVLLGLGGTWLFGDSETRGAVQRVARAAAATSVLTRVIKIYVGRARPVASESGRNFLPVHFDYRYNSFPSGHTALAFSLAHAIDDEIDNRFAEIGVYALSTLVGWSRVRQDKHWLSDVTAGAIEGILVTRLLRDRRLLPEGPRLSFAPHGLAVIVPVGF